MASSQQSDSPPPPTSESYSELDELIPAKPAADEALTLAIGDQNAVKRRAMLDNLFYTLRHTADQNAAAKISRQIQGVWEQSGSPTINLLLQWSEKAMLAGDFAQALDYLDNAIALRPNYAEAWYRRAVAHYLTDDLEIAMYDLAQTLEYEPRNYNALVLLATIMDVTDRRVSAVHAYQAALEIFPQMKQAQRRLGELLQEISGRAA